MTARTRRVRFVPRAASYPLVAALFCGGCVPQPKADPTRFYLLIPIAPAAKGPAAPEEIFRVRLKEVELPAYLQSKSLAVRSRATEVVYEEFHRWAEPLDEGIARVLAKDLSALSDGKWMVRSRDSAAPDFEIALRITACEGVKDAEETGSSSFGATWEVTAIRAQGSAAVKRGVFEAAPTAWDGRDYGALVERLSLALAELARKIDGILEEAPRGE